MRVWTALGLLVALLLGACFHDGGEAGSATAGAETSAAPATATATSGPASASATTASSTDADPTTGSGAASTSGATTSSDTTAVTQGTRGTQGVCGDGEVDDDEECDLGPANDDEGLCTTSCNKARCGDGYAQADLGEECDLGELNNPNAACTDTCQKATCGDGKVFWGVEECDDGELNQAGLYDGCTPMTCTKGPHCGDANLDQPQEECDLGANKNGEADQPCTAMCGLAGKMIFATSKLYSGQIGNGGVAAADDQCKTVAMEAELANANAFRAWISDGSSSPATWTNKPAGPFILPGAKAIVAESWEDLVDGALLAPIDSLETGATIDSIKRAWTGTSPQGLALADRCIDWSSGAKEQKGVYGRLGEIGAEWTSFSVLDCPQPARIICVEQ